MQKKKHGISLERGKEKEVFLRAKTNVCFSLRAPQAKSRVLPYISSNVTLQP